MDTQNKKRGIERVFPFLMIGSLFILINFLALAVIAPFDATGLYIFEDPDDPLNILSLFLILLISTIMMFFFSRLKKKVLIQGILLGSIGLLSFNVFYSLLVIIFNELLSLFLSVTVAIFLVFILYKYPRWYVIDICSILVGASSIAMLGISLNISLTIILLVGLAIYDAISVYRTRHMIRLAETVLKLKLPAFIIIPKIRNYTLSMESYNLTEKIKEKGERKAFLIGLGDFVFPGVLVASTFYNIASNGLIIALSVMVGTLLSLIPLMLFVLKGKPQAGLPFLCTGAILGYLISSYLQFGNLVGLVG